MRGRRRDPHPLFHHHHHHHHRHYHPRRLLSLFGNLSSDSVQLSSVAPLGRCGSRVVASSRKLSRAREIISHFFFKFIARPLLSLLSHFFLSRTLFFAGKIRGVHVLGKEKTEKSAASVRCFFSRRSTIATR